MQVVVRFSNISWAHNPPLVPAPYAEAQIDDSLLDDENAEDRLGMLLADITGGEPTSYNYEIF